MSKNEKNKLKIGLFSGIHGDEKEIILSVKRVMEKIKNGNCLFIPNCSPSAISQNTRLNKEGNDLNRCFVKYPQDIEAKNIISAIKIYHFDVCVDFHEDSQLSGVYVYDSSNIEGTSVLDDFRKQVREICPLYTGLDDEKDERLGCFAVQGYYSCLPPQVDTFGNYIYEGFLDIWALIENITDRWITLEVPAKLSQSQKDKIVDIFFHTLLGKYLY